MKRIFMMAAVSALALVSCQKDLGFEEKNAEERLPEESGVVFTATTEGSDTRTALSENEGRYNVVWRSGDRITIVDGSGTPNVGEYSTTSETTIATFTKESGADPATTPYKAWYPAALYNAGTPTLPATQDYVAGNISGMPMYAESSTTALSFKNLCGIIRVNLKTNQSGIKVKTVSLHANAPLSGAITNAASLVSDGYAAAVSGTAGVTLDCGEGVDINNSDYTPFYIAVPQNLTGYADFTITVTTTTGSYQTFTVKSGTRIVVERSKITDISLTAKNILYDLPATYLPVEYLASTGAQYINTGVSCDYNTHVDIDFMYTASKVSEYPGGNDKGVYWKEGGSVFGAHGQSRANGIYEYCIWWHGTGLITQPTYTDPLFAVGTRYNVKVLTSSKVSIDGVEKTTNDLGAYNNASNNFALFANYSSMNSRWTYFSVARIYSCKMYDADNVWLRYFVPCVRVSDGKPGMYDRVNNVFYTNSGDGADFNTSVVDLSAVETANTYMVRSAGSYKFNATVKGNGGLDPLTGMTATTIDAANIAGVRVLWELSSQGRAIKHNGVSYDISYSDGYVYFSTPDSFVPGDACVAIYDSSDNILWSWVIWATPDPGTTTHNGKTFMDRNLGAIDVGNCMRGFLYQWGRKDAFSAANGNNYSYYTFVPAANTTFGTLVSSAQSMAYTVLNPTVRITKYPWMLEEERLTSPWRDDIKTIYDPCPEGWRVPTKTDMADFTSLPNTGMYDPDTGSGYNYFGNPSSGYYQTSTIGTDDKTKNWAYCNDNRLAEWGQTTGRAIRPVRE